MAIQPMALGVDTTPVNAMQDFSQGAASGMKLEEMKRDQAERGISMIAKISLGAMGGDLNGQVNAQHYEQGLDLLEKNGVDVSKFRGRPDLAKVAARASLTALEQIKIAQSDKDYQLALQKFEADLNSGGSAETFGVSPIEGTIEGQPSYLQIGNKGTVKQLELPEGWEASGQFEKVDTADGTLVINKKTNEQTFIPKNLRGAEREKQIGQEEGKREGTEPQRQAAAQSALSDYKRQREVVGGDIKRVISQIKASPGLSAGFLGSKLATIEGTPAYNIARAIDTIAANIGFDKLQAMREASPTGGALGQVSEKENQLLQAVQGSLDQGQSPDQLIRNLERIEQLAQDILAEREAAFNKDFSGDVGTDTEEDEDGFVILGVE